MAKSWKPFTVKFNKSMQMWIVTINFRMDPEEHAFCTKEQADNFMRGN